MQRELQIRQNEPVKADDQMALVAMLYDNAVSCLKMAVQAINSKQIETRWKYNRQAQEIINNLYAMLDLDKGGEIASNLEALYTYMQLRLPDVDIRNDARAAEEVIELLDPLRASWRELARSSVEFERDQQEIDTVVAIAADRAIA